MLKIELPERLNAASVFVDRHVAEGRGAKPAILCGDRTVTYQQLHEDVNRLGNGLLQLGVRVEERVAMLLPDSPEWATDVLRGDEDRRGGAAAEHEPEARGLRVLPARQPRSGARRGCFAAGSRGRVAAEAAVSRARAGRGGDAPGCPALDAVLRDASRELEPADTGKDEMAFWLYSSGTTGRPKGAIHLHHDMIVAADLYARETLGIGESDVSFSVAKLFFAFGLGNGLYFPLRVGGTTVLLPDRPTPEKVFETIERFQPTLFYSVPTSYVQLLNYAETTGRSSLGRVRLCISAGEPLPEHLFEKWRERFGSEILDGIGSTEILHIFISNRAGHARPGSTGQVVPGYEAKVVDEMGKELPPRHVGTLHIKGDSIAAGYWNKHEETKDTFCGHWINTHDKFLVDDDGYFWYAGRTDDMFKVSGQAVWPTDVEGLLMRHPAVLESGVVGGLDPNGLVKPVAFVVLKGAHRPSLGLAREIQDFVKSITSPHKYPRAVVFVESLPKTATGKIQRYQLRELVGRLTPLHSQQG